MRVIDQPLGLQQGSLVLFSDFADGGPMWSGQGEREQRVPVRFDEAFAGVPMVQLALSMWDIDSRSNSRVDLQAREVTAEGFEILFRTWGDTRVARVRASWLALGPARDDERWDVS